MSKITIAICDDEIMTGQLEDLIDGLAREMKLDFEIQSFTEYEKLYSILVQDKLKYDLLILGIKISSLNGIDMGMTVRRELSNYDVPIIFVSPYSYVYERFVELQPYYYVRVPIENEDFSKKFLMALARLKGQNILYVLPEKKHAFHSRQVLRIEQFIVIAVQLRNILYQFFRSIYTGIQVSVCIFQSMIFSPGSFEQTKPRDQRPYHMYIDGVCTIAFRFDMRFCILQITQDIGGHHIP